MPPLNFQINEIYSGEMTSGEMYSGEMYSGEMYSGEMYSGEMYSGETYTGEIDIIKDTYKHSFPLILLIILIPIGCFVLCFCLHLCSYVMTDIRNGNMNRYIGDNSSMSSWGSNYSSPRRYSDDFSYNFDKEVQIDKSKRFIIQDMEKFILNKINKEKTRDNMCAICINDYEEGDEIISFDCSHDYHLDCVGPWLKENIHKRQAPKCPLCKEVLIIEYVEETEFGIEI